MGSVTTEDEVNGMDPPLGAFCHHMSAKSRYHDLGTDEKIFVSKLQLQLKSTDETLQQLLCSPTKRVRAAEHVMYLLSVQLKLHNLIIDTFLVCYFHWHRIGFMSIVSFYILS